MDLHFHGAFGIDLMSADFKGLDKLASLLKKNGIHAFCPTTLSEKPQALLATVDRLGQWIKRRHQDCASKAFPIGIHLEGPFISPRARGAHSPNTVRKVTIVELESLWLASHKTICLITLAPEEIKSPKALIKWAKTRKITLAAGHTIASSAQAEQAFKAGFSGITHAFNAMPFHHREPGLIGAALKHPKVHIEVIIDQIHVHPAAIRLLANSFKNQLCFVSDCAPSACTLNKSWHRFGSLKIQNKNGAARLANGALAGGGQLLGESLIKLISNKSFAIQNSKKQLQQEVDAFCHHNPLKALHPSWTKRVPK